MKRFAGALLCLLVSAVAVAQGTLSAVAHDDVSTIEREAYRESPYYMEINGTWQQRRTDSSIRYTRSLDVERTWKDYLVYLNVRCGRGCRVILNDKEVGTADDSRHWNSFLLDGYLKYGKENVLTIEALKHPEGALLEDSTIAVGLNGEPFILFKSDPGVADLSLTADYDAATQNGTLTVDALVKNSKRKGRYYVEVEILDPTGRRLDRMGRWIIFDGKKDEEHVDISRQWNGVSPWNAEQPALYTAVVRLRNEKMEEEELVGGRFGFRRVEVADGQLKVNGVPIMLRGVTYGVEHTEGYSSRVAMENAVKSMKANNINAVRTSRYSPMDDWFYAMCDRYGLYVVADANLMPVSSGRRAVATEQDMIPLFEHRVDNLYSSLKNHPSVIAWSLGNTMDNGICMTAAYKRIKMLDKSRPTMFSGAQYGDNTDIIFPTFPKPQALKQSMAKQQGRPTVIAKMETGVLSQLWTMSGRQGLQGGFVDGWPLSSDWLYEMRNLYAPFKIDMVRIGGGEGEFRVYNLCDFANFAQNRLEYTIYTNLRSNIISGELPLAVRAGESDKVSMQVPQLQLHTGEEPYIRFDVSRRKGNSSVGRVVFPLQMRMPHFAENPEIQAAANPDIRLEMTDSSGLDIVAGRFGATFDSVLTIRDNNTSKVVAVPYLIFSTPHGSRRSVVAYNHRLVDSHTLCIDAMVRYSDITGVPLCDAGETYTIHSSGDVTVDYSLSAPDGGKSSLKAMANVARLHAGQRLHWFGQERNTLIDDGLWHMSAICNVPTERFNPGNERGEVRWLLLEDTTYTSAVFACIADTTVTMRNEFGALTLIPNGNRFRLHLKLWTLPADSVSDLCAAASYKMPTVLSGIPKPPVITADAPRFAQPLKVTVKSISTGEIRYTLDGSEPTSTSHLYTSPFVLDKTTIVKARVFTKDTPPSFTATRKFNYDYILRTTFSRKPNTPYNVGTDTLLFDGDRGTADNLSFGWLGFSGNDIQTTVELAKPLNVESVGLRFAHNPSLWAFAPRSVTLTFSADGQHYSDTATVVIPFDPADNENSEPRVVEVNVPSNANGIGYIRIVAHTIGQVPEWHRAKGLNPWLMMDEIEVAERFETVESKEKSALK